MNYIGSKLKLSTWIKEEILKVVGDNLRDKIFCDIFAGTGAIGRAFKDEVKQVIANDLEYFAYVLNRNYIGNHKKIKNEDELLNELNTLKPLKNGFIYDNYCKGSGSERQYFSDENGKKIDTVRQKIQEWSKKGRVNNDTYFFLLASLLECSDKVANTASVYGAFLKHLKKSAQKSLILKGAYFSLGENRYKVYNEDSNELIKKVEGDILYLDPPYNHRQYGANYHILNTISLYDKFKPQGVSGLREYNRSNYCKKKEIGKSFESLIKDAKFEYIFLSYNNEGLMSKEDIVKVMAKYGRYDLKVKKYQRFKADKTQNRRHKADATFEYLHILEKR